MQNDRLDVFVSEKQGITRSAAQRLIEQGNVSVNGIAAAKNYRVREGDMIDVIIPPPAPSEAIPQDIPLDIKYEDDDIIVINKPKGMVVHPAPGNPDCTLVNALLWHCGGKLSHGSEELYEGEDAESDSENSSESSALTGIGGVIRPGIVHRIDKDTSGLLVIAKNDAAHLALAESLKAHKMGRFYEAVIRGVPKEKEFTVDAPIGRDIRDRKKMAVTSSGRDAVTHCTVLSEYTTPCGRFSLVRLQLETGRTHQIRVHMAHIGHPVIGDTLYGGSGTKFERENAELLCGQCLNARTLEIIHPKSGEMMTFDSKRPRYFTVILEKLAILDESYNK